MVWVGYMIAKHNFNPAIHSELGYEELVQLNEYRKAIKTYPLVMDEMEREPMEINVAEIKF